MKESKACITIKDYTEYFMQKLNFRLINHLGFYIGTADKHIRDNINLKVFQKIQINQRKNSAFGTEWLKGIQNKAY